MTQGACHSRRLALARLTQMCKSNMSANPSSCNRISRPSCRKLRDNFNANSTRNMQRISCGWYFLQSLNLAIIRTRDAQSNANSAAITEINFGHVFGFRPGVRQIHIQRGREPLKTMPLTSSMELLKPKGRSFTVSCAASFVE